LIDILLLCLLSIRLIVLLKKRIVYAKLRAVQNNRLVYNTAFTFRLTHRSYLLNLANCNFLQFLFLVVLLFDFDLFQIQSDRSNNNSGTLFKFLLINSQVREKKYVYLGFTFGGVVAVERTHILNFFGGIKIIVEMLK